MINAGILLGYLAGWGIHAAYPGWLGSWRVMLGLGALPPLLLAAGIMVLPESPRWLIRKGREEEARRILKVRRFDS